SVAAFRGDDGRELAVLEPPKEPAKLGPKDSVVVERAEERLERVDDDPFGADRVDAVSKPDEEPLEVVLARLLDLAPFDVDIVEKELLVGHQPVEVESERPDVLRQVLGPLLERQEHARLPVLRRSPDEELHPEERLARARAATY